MNEKNGRKKLSHAFRFTLISNINFDVRTFSNFSIQSTRFIFICEQSAFDSLQSLAAVYKSSAICLCVYLFHTDAICQSVGEFIALFDEREREKKKQTNIGECKKYFELITYHMIYVYTNVLCVCGVCCVVL